MQEGHTNNIIKKKAFLSRFFVIINKHFYNNINIEIFYIFLFSFIIRKP